MTVLLPFVINAGLNFVLGLLIAFFLGPEAFGRYAIGAAIIVLVNTAMLDWLKLSAVRFYSLGTRESQPEIRATLDLLVAGVSMTLCALLVAAIAAGVDFRMPAMMLAASVLAGIGAGLFDYHGAIARARFLDAAYARLVIVKNVLALILMVGGAWLTRDPTVVLLGGLLSAAVALISVRRRLADAPLSVTAARRDLAWTFAKYALPIVAGNAIYSLMPLLNRSLVAGAHGFAEAGYFSLASDMGLRLFGTLGATLEIILLREVLRLDETRGRRAAQKRIAANLTIVLAVALPAAVGFALALPAFDRLLVPPSFQGRFSAYMALLLPGFVALTIFQAGLYPAFLLEKRTLVATLAAVAGLAANGAIVFVFAASPPTIYAVAQSVALLLVLAITATAALRILPVRPSLRDGGAILLAVTAMALAIAPLQGRLPAAAELTLQVGLGALVYVAVILACDVARWRTLLWLWWAARRSRRR
ncbi:lipopolysaccharide biosynthesis protein [Bosea sp. (in: a-proteobacteria)]|uniref:lipopolysaccharide biosynthesis protein n=1 Tax=Bosea sp. (in: a-proteobacteria) TaxID=1871050 RepID=UPI002735D6AA|nr:lipopolysaccharide biosynthesis protein [Bosea sp. (in: a-proteobacteria)]MDP3408872.1 lipopolysaccharide biosynthesis protein [Bosea sp. (in: a-proteobacteria)]